MEKIIQENAVKQKKKKPGLKFNPGLALIGLPTTGSGPWNSALELLAHFKCQIKWNSGPQLQTSALGH